MSNICFVSIDVEGDFGRQANFQGTENLNLILDIFGRHNVPATLFVTGQVLRKYPALVLGWSKKNEISCHSFTHKFWNILSRQERKEELQNFIELYKKTFGKMPLGFRAPSHIIDAAGLKLLQEQGFLYDSSVVPHYPFFKKYRGYQGPAPLLPYYPADDNPRKKGKMNILEIPVRGQIFALPLAGVWIAKLPPLVYKFLFVFFTPRFLTLNLHSWDVLNPRALVKTDKLLTLLKKRNYDFLSGEEIVKRQGSRVLGLEFQ